MFLFGSLRTRHKGYKYRRSSGALVGVSGDGPPYSTPELAKRKEVCGDRRPENDCQIRQPRD